MAVNLADEFAPPAEVKAPVSTATSNESVDLMTEFQPPPKQEQYAVVNDVVDKEHQWKRAFDPNVPKEQQTEAAKQVLSGMLDSFGDHATAKTKKTILQNWEDMNKPLIELPLAPAVPSEENTPASMRPMRGTASILGGVYNGVAPVISSLTSPLNIGTLGVFGALSRIAQGAGLAATMAKNALTAIKTGFGMEMAKGAGATAGQASVTVPGDQATLQEKTADVVGTLVQSGLAALAGHSAVADVVAPSSRGPAVNPDAVNEAIGKATDAKLAEAAKDISLIDEFNAKLDQIPGGPKVEKVDSGPRDAAVSTGDGVPTAKEQVVVDTMKKEFDEHLAKQADDNITKVGGMTAEEFTAWSSERSGTGGYTAEARRAGTAAMGSPEILAKLQAGEAAAKAELAAAMEAHRGLEGEAAVQSSEKLNALASKKDFFSEALKKVEETKALTPEVKRIALNQEFTPPAEPIEIPQKVPVAVEPVERITGIKNADVDAQLKDMGLPPAKHGERMSFEEGAADALKKVSADPESGTRLVNELAENPRPLTGAEDALILHELTRRGNERAAAETALNEAVKAGDLQAIADAQARVKKATDDYAIAAEADTKAGTSNAIGLALRRMRMKEDFTLAAMERRRQVANEGQELTPEQVAETKSLHEKINATQKAFDDYVKQSNERMAKMEKTQAGTRNTDRNVVSKFIDRKADEARARIKARYAEGRVQSGLDPADLADHALIGAQHIKNGLAELAAWSEAMVKEFGERIKPHLDEIFAKSKEFQTIAAVERAEEIRLKSFKTRTAGRMEELEQRLEEGDFTPREKPAPLVKDAEANMLQAKLEQAKEQYAAALERDRYNRLTALQKLKETVTHTYDMARIIMTTGEFSFINRQGKVAALARPIIAAKAMPNAFRALFSDPVASHALQLEIINHPDIAAARQAKLFLIEKGHSLSKQEEILMGKWTDNLDQYKATKWISRFNQAAEVFLNKVRFDMWRAMRGTGGLDVANDRQVAMFVNEATGRGGLGKLEAAAVPLGRAMFSPRFFASRLQLLVGHSLWGGTAKSRKIIAKEYARALVGLGVYYSLLRLGLGDDDKHKAQINTDPRSSDFGKVKIGESRLDPLAGIAQVVVFGARTATGEKTSSKGKVAPIRGDKIPYGGDKWSDVATNFARSKLHPVPGAIVNLFDGTDLAGNKADLSGQALNMMAPITYMDIYQALEEQDLPDGVALGLLALLGEGLQTYKKKPSKAAPIIEAPKPLPAPVSP